MIPAKVLKDLSVIFTAGLTVEKLAVIRLVAVLARIVMARLH